MPRVLREAYLASLGIISLTYDKARQLSNELIKKGELAKEKQQKFITDLLEEARKNTKEISKIINKKVEYLAKKGESLKEKQMYIPLKSATHSILNLPLLPQFKFSK